MLSVLWGNWMRFGSSQRVLVSLWRPMLLNSMRARSRRSIERSFHHLLACQGAAQHCSWKPEDLLCKAAVETYGVLEDPVFCIRNVDVASGAKIRDITLSAVEAADLMLPLPAGRKRRRRLSPKAGLRIPALYELSNQLLEAFRASSFGAAALLQDFGVSEQRWGNTELVVRAANDGPIKRHIDMGGKSHLLIILNVGLASQNVVWPHTGDEVSIILESGDVLAFDGLTEHAAPRILADTSPFSEHPWVGKNRLGVLVREVSKGVKKMPHPACLPPKNHASSIISG